MYLGARRLGISARWFWAATPLELAWEVKACTERERERKARIWTVAALPRLKKFPSFEQFVGKSEKRPQSWQDMRARLRAAAESGDGYQRGDHRPQRSQPRTPKIA